MNNITVELNWQQSAMLREILLETLKEELLSQKTKNIIADILIKLNEEK